MAQPVLYRFIEQDRIENVGQTGQNRLESVGQLVRGMLADLAVGAVEFTEHFRFRPLFLSKSELAEHLVEKSAPGRCPGGFLVGQYALLRFTQEMRRIAPERGQIMA